MGPDYFTEAISGLFPSWGPSSERPPRGSRSWWVSIWSSIRAQGCHLRGSQPLANSASGAQQKPGVSFCDSCVPLGVPALWAPSQMPAAAVASRKAEYEFPFSPPRLLRLGPGAISPGLLQGASSVPPAGKWKCASWIAVVATAVAGNEEAVATPAGEPGRRAEARGSESRAPASLALGRADWRAGGTAGTPRHREAPRTHPPRGCPGPVRTRRRARAAAGRELGPPRLSLAA